MDAIDKIGHGISVLFTGIIGLAILAIVLSSGSNTVSVLQAFFSGLTSLITAVVTPVSGGSSVLNLSSGSSGGSADNGLPSSFTSGWLNSGAGSILSSIGQITANSGGSADDGLIDSFLGGFQ